MIAVADTVARCTADFSAKETSCGVSGGLLSARLQPVFGLVTLSTYFTRTTATEHR